MVRSFLLDSNFFISLKKAQGINSIFKALKQLEEKPELWITSQIFAELKGFHNEEKNQIKRHVRLESIHESSINMLRKKIKSKHPPQTSDLSLLVLGKKHPDPEWILITDDLKLAQTAQELNLEIEVWTPSIFLLYLSRNAKSSEFGDLLYRIWQNVVLQELEYAIERKDIYPPKSKLAWLIERTTRVTGRDFGQIQNKRCQTPQEVQQAIMRYLMDEQLRSDQKKTISPLLPYLKGLRGYHRTTLDIQHQMGAGNLISAAKQLTSTLLKLRADLQIGLIALDPLRSSQLLETFTAVTAQYSFLAGICQINSGNLNEAVASFSAAALDSLIAGYDANAVRFNYLAAVLLMADHEYQNAITQYRHTQELANKIDEEIIRLKARVGESVALFFAGSKKEANDSLKKTLIEIRKDPILAATIFNEFGDQLYSLGLIDVAFHIYQEGYSNAIENHRYSEAYDALADLTRCYFNLGKPIQPLLDVINQTITIVKKNKKTSQITKLELLKERVDSMVSAIPAFLQQPGSLDFNSLDPRLRDWLPVIHVVDQEEDDLVIVHLDGIGNIGIIIPNLPLRIPIPESMQIRINKNTKVDIQKPEHPDSNKFYVRAEILCPNNECLEFRSTLFESVAL